MAKTERLQMGAYYHIYNRGNNRETLYRTPENYRFFLKRYAQFIEPVAKTFAYCLLPNHFHLSIYVRTAEEQRAYHEQTCQVFETWQVLSPSKAFSNLFNSYAKSFNKRFDRTGSLFEKPFERKPVENERYFTTLIVYIHRNPQMHGLVDDFRDWPWSSYPAIVSEKETRVCRKSVLDWFGGRSAFIEGHARDVDDSQLDSIIGADW